MYIFAARINLLYWAMVQGRGLQFVLLAKASGLMSKVILW